MLLPGLACDVARGLDGAGCHCLRSGWPIPAARWRVAGMRRETLCVVPASNAADRAPPPFPTGRCDTQEPHPGGPAAVDHRTHSYLLAMGIWLKRYCSTVCVSNPADFHAHRWLRN